MAITNTTEFTPYGDFITTGIVTSDTFNSWRKKTNGIINEVDRAHDRITNISITPTQLSLGAPTWTTDGSISTYSNGTSSFSAGQINGSNIIASGTISGITINADITNGGVITGTSLKLGTGGLPPASAGGLNSLSLAVGANNTEFTVSTAGAIKGTSLNVGNGTFTATTAGVATASRLLVGSGSTAAPSISFSADGGQDTGFNHTTDGRIDVVCNGQTPGVFTSAGFSGTSAKASTLSNGGGVNAMQFNYNGLTGQPIWVWGSNDGNGSQNYVWNPANFSVLRASNGPDGGTFSTGVMAPGGGGHSRINVLGFAGGAGPGINFVASSGTTASPAYACIFYNNNNTSTAVGNINITGSRTQYTTSSDYRLKTDYKPIKNAVDRVDSLNPLNFKWISDGEISDGFLAHELMAVVPEAVAGYKDQVDDDGKPVYQSVDASKVIPLLTAAIKELSARVEALEAAQR